MKKELFNDRYGSFNEDLIQFLSNCKTVFGKQYLFKTVIVPTFTLTEIHNQSDVLLKRFKEIQENK